MKSITSIILCLWAFGAMAEPKVLTSIRPLGMIAQAVVGEAGSVEVLLPPSVAHHYSLTVSDRRKLNDADWVVWVGESLEGFLADVLELRGAPVMTAMNLNLSWPAPLEDDHDARKHHDHSHKPAHHHGSRDPHLWLNPMNTVVIAEALAEELSKKYPKNAEIYRENAAKFGERMVILDERLRRQLAPIRPKPFIVYHPAYEHFVKHFDLNQQGFIVRTAEQPVSAKRLIALGKSSAECVLGEVGQQDKTVIRLARALDAGVGTIDPLGQQGQASIDQLIQMIADELVRCFSDKS